MKTILIATDFSKASRNAMLYGVQLAKEINAKIILFNAYTIPAPAAGLGVSISQFGVRIQTEQKLKKEIDRVQDINMHLIEPLCDEGDAAEAISNFTQERNVNFIIVGMKGNGQNMRKIFGSTTTALAKKSNIPVIVVPEFAKYVSPQNIIFATENIINSDEKLPGYLKEISKLFKSKLNVVSVVNKDHKQPAVHQETQHPDKVAYTFDTSFNKVVDADIRHALNDFIKTHHCDMLVMMPHKHDWVERLFQKSETKNMIFHTHIPLLVLPESFLTKSNSAKINNFSTK
jgi:nucleotide-binding universal stress UspA family protein